MDKSHYFNDPLLESTLAKAHLVILDLNGLIVDDEELQLNSVNMALLPHRIKIDETYWMRFCVGKRADVYFRDLLSKHDIDYTDRDIAILIDEKNRYYRNYIKQRVKSLVRPGVMEFMSYIYHSTKHKLACATSAHKEELETIIGRNGLNILHLFTYTITGEEVLQAKPHPQIYLKLLEIARIKPEISLAFDDSETGITAAVQAGIPCIAVPNRFTSGQSFEGARFIVSDLTPHAKIIGHSL